MGLEAVYTGSERGRKSLNRVKDAQFTKQYINTEKERTLLEGDTKYIVVKKEPQLLLEDKSK